MLWQIPLGFVWTWLLTKFAAMALILTPDSALGYVELPVAVAVGAIYAVLTVSGIVLIAQSVLNRTIVTATASQLRVTHGPIPGEGRYTLLRKEIVQLTCVQVPGWLRASWDLMAVKPGGGYVRLIRGRPLEELLEIERAVEKKLGIVDVPLPPSALLPAQPFLRKSIHERLLPPRLQTLDRADRLVISWRWFNPSAFVGVLILVAAIAANTPWAFMALGYFVLAFVLNRTVVSVIRGGTFAIRHGPVPLLPQLTVPVADVRQVFVQPGTVRVLAHLASGRRITLARMPDAESAAAIESKIEQWLGIEDEPAPPPQEASVQ